MRDGPLRNDSAFESASADLAKLQSRFDRTAMLVKTAVGALQMSRLQRERNIRLNVFSDEKDALDFLKS